MTLVYTLLINLNLDKFQYAGTILDKKHFSFHSIPKYSFLNNQKQVESINFKLFLYEHQRVTFSSISNGSFDMIQSQ